MHTKNFKCGNKIIGDNSRSPKPVFGTRNGLTTLKTSLMGAAMTADTVMRRRGDSI